MISGIFQHFLSINLLFLALWALYWYSVLLSINLDVDVDVDTRHGTDKEILETRSHNVTCDQFKRNLPGTKSLMLHIICGFSWTILVSIVVFKRIPLFKVTFTPNNSIPKNGFVTIILYWVGWGWTPACRLDWFLFT